MDNKMKDPDTKSSCGVLNSSILEELGVVSYVLTDKTGTLTANEMVFRKIAVEDRIYDRENIKAHIDELSKHPAVN
jgi:phospholipid-transporting ATPase